MAAMDSAMLAHAPQQDRTRRAPRPQRNRKLRLTVPSLSSATRCASSAADVRRVRNTPASGTYPGSSISTAARRAPQPKKSERREERSAQIPPGSPGHLALDGALDHLSEKANPFTDEGKIREVAVREMREAGVSSLDQRVVVAGENRSSRLVRVER